MYRVAYSRQKGKRTLKINKILLRDLEDIMDEIEKNNAYLGFIKEAVTVGKSIPDREELGCVLTDIWIRNRLVVKLMKDLYKDIE